MRLFSSLLCCVLGIVKSLDMESPWKDNQTLDDCLEENFGKTTLDCSRCFRLQDRPLWQLYIHSFIIATIMLVTVIGNGLIVVLVVKYKQLRHRAVIFSLSVILANTVLVLTYHLPVVISTVSKGWLFAFKGCQVFGFLSTDFIITRWLTMGVLALDRYSIVRFPFSYKRYNKLVSVVLLSAAWVIPALLSIVTVDGYSAVVFRPNVPTCLLYAPSVGKGLLFFSLVLTFSFLAGGILPTIMYVWLFLKARRLRKSMLNVGKINNSKENIVSIQDMNSNSNSEKRAVLTFSLIFVAFCMTGLPICLFQVLRSLSLSMWCRIPHIVHFMVVQLFLSSTALDPFLVLRDRDFRKRLKHLLCCHNNCGKYYHERSNIHPEIPPERDLDAIRSMAVRALNLFSGPLQNERGSRNVPPNLDKLSHPYRPRTGSAPPACYGGLQRPSHRPRLPITIDEGEGKEERKIRDQANGSCVMKGTNSESDLGRREVEVEAEIHDHIKHEVVYSDSENECIQVSIRFGD